MSLEFVDNMGELFEGDLHSGLSEELWDHDRPLVSRECPEVGEAARIDGLFLKASTTCPSVSWEMYLEYVDIRLETCRFPLEVLWKLWGSSQSFYKDRYGR